LKSNRVSILATLGLLTCLGISPLGLSSMAQAQSSDMPSLMPLPAHMQRTTGAFPINGSLGVKLEGYTEPRLERARERFLQRLAAETGVPLWPAANSNQAGIVIHTTAASAPVQKLDEDESYQLTVTPASVNLTAPNPLGVLRGLQTILQLVQVSPDGFVLPAVEIKDSPRFPWRGLMIDSSRHFMPLDMIRRNLDGMEAVKLNVMHWHISDDQGFRAQSLKFPLLTKDGSNGSFYTQGEMREIIEYARDRGIRVYVEFDMPCHTSSWFVGYPNLSSGKGPYQVQTTAGVFDDAMDPTRETTYQFIDTFIGEMAALFPDAYFHIGGDECNGKQWDANADIKAWMKSHNIADNAALQAYFTARVQKLVTKHGKITAGWDEILQPGTPKDVVIQSWRGPKALAQAARDGYRGILSNGYYIDLNQSAEFHYLNDPTGGDAASLTPEQKKNILGGEATMWAEYVSPENVDSRIWPRTAAIAERLWSPQDVRDIPSMYARMGDVSLKLEYYGLKHRSVTPMMMRRMTGTAVPPSLAVLGSVVQPPEGYDRGELSPGYTTTTPLNRLVDAVPPESIEARDFLLLSQRIAAGKATPQEWELATQKLSLWRDNDAKLQPILPNSDLTKELIPLSANVSKVAELGLQALLGLPIPESVAPPNGVKMRDSERLTAIEFVKKSQQPQAVLLNKIAPGVLLLLQANAPK
jgi:hexosaminidase